MRKVLITCPCYEERCKEGLEYLAANDCEAVINHNGRPYYFDELKEMVSDIDGVIAGSDYWDARVFECAPKLKAIARFGIGIENFNLEDFKKYGIRANNAPGLNKNAVAEQAIGLMFSVIRNIPNLDASTKKGGWVRYVTHEFQYYTIGLCGFGGVAKTVAEKLQPFGSKIIAYDVCHDEETARRLNVTFVTLEELLAQSDIVSIHVPCTPETRGMFNKETFAKMKPGAYVINTARGPIVKESDMYDALVDGTITAYGTDVFETEPVDPKNPLFTLENYICTPHTAAETYENYQVTGLYTAKSIVAMLNGEDAENMLV